MILNVDVHAGNVVLNAAAAPVFHGVNLAVDDQHRAEGIVAGHCHHARRNALAARGNAVGILTAAFTASAIMRYIDLERIKRCAEIACAAAGRRAVVDPVGTAIVFHIARRVEHNAALGT